MTDYSKMSDAEINQEVTCTLNPEAKRMPLIADGSCFYDCGPDGSSFFEIPVRDYCNSWADAGPITQQSGIALMPDSTAGWWIAFTDFTLYDGDWLFASDPANHACGSNPLRAAMIVFLMIKDAEKEQGK